MDAEASLRWRSGAHPASTANGAAFDFGSPGTVETARSGPPRYDMHIQLPQGDADERREYALSAFRHQDRAEDGGPSADGGCHYNVRLQPQDGAVAPGGETFCGKLLCSADGTRYTFCDDPSNFYSWPRELGAVVVSAENLVVLLPRVHPSGAAAQFRVLKQEDGIIARFFAGQARQHLSLLSGPWATKRSGGEVRAAGLHPLASACRLHPLSSRLQAPAAAGSHSTHPRVFTPHRCSSCYSAVRRAEGVITSGTRSSSGRGRCRVL